MNIDQWIAAAKAGDQLQGSVIVEALEALKAAQTRATPSVNKDLERVEGAYTTWKDVGSINYPARLFRIETVSGDGSVHWISLTVEEAKSVIRELTAGIESAPKPGEVPDFHCRVCGKDTRFAPDPPEQAICPECCGVSEDGHEYEYERGEQRHECKYCGEPATDEWYASRAQD